MRKGEKDIESKTPMAEVLEEDLSEVFRIRYTPMLLAGKKYALFFYSPAQAHALVDAFQDAIFLLEVDVVGSPIALHAVQPAVGYQLAAVKIAPRTEQVVIVVHIGPVLKLLNDGRKGAGPVDILLLNGGELPAEWREHRMDYRADESVEFASYISEMVNPEGTNLNSLLYVPGGCMFPAGGFQIKNDVVHVLKRLSKEHVYKFHPTDMSATTYYWTFLREHNFSDLEHEKQRIRSERLESRSR